MFDFHWLLNELMLNFGVRINSDFLPKWPSKTARELCTLKPIATEKNVKNIPIYLKKFLMPPP